MTLHHDGKLDIATGRDRHTRTWANKSITWSALLDRLSSTHRTAETFAEYLAAKPARQAEIKDVGGFVGGYLAAGRRKTGSVTYRQLLTLDADYAPADFWERFTLLHGCAACIYSTHKHSPEAPRLRLLIPLDREVLADEYVPLARKIAESLGIDYFDHTGFRPTQLMYWPSTAKDGEYVFEYQDGPWLSADEVLGSYRDWRDSSAWPMGSRELEIPVRSMKKQGDPLAKDGLVGAFCRSFSITEALETFLGEVYEPTDQPDRWTYKAGSSAGGLVIYEDKYAYSHHGTDPSSGKLCNAFDLVRLHLFGLQDEDAAEETPPNKLPSFKAMLDFAASSAPVKSTLAQERAESVRYDFGEDLQDDISEEDADTDWIKDLEFDQKGNIRSSINNAVLILRNDPRLKGRIGFNLFDQREMVLRDLPWRRLRNNSRYFEDADDANLRHYMESIWRLSGKEKIQDAVNIIVRDNAFHPIRDFFKGLHWDGKPRLDRLFIDYMGAEDSDYTKAVTRKMFVAAVARVHDPGCKFDNMLVLVGPQGAGKSTIIDKIANGWFTDSLNFHMLKGDSKRAEEQIQGAWLVEVGELAGMAKADLESAKSFLSRREDRYRAAYGKRVSYYPRQCVFFGTTNNDEFLRDMTGNRRFWPLPVDPEAATKSVFTDLGRFDIEQLWAESMHYYKANEPLFLAGELALEAAAMQEAHTEVDERVGMILDYLDTPLPEDWATKDTYERHRFFVDADPLKPAGTVPRQVTCAAEIWIELFGGKLKELNQGTSRFITSVIKKAPGWKPSKSVRKFDFCGKQRAFCREVLTPKNR